MKTLVLFSLSLTAALGTSILPPGVELHPDVRGEDQSPLLGDLLPVQGHVVVENPAPPVSLSSKELQEKTAPVEIKAKLEVKGEPEVKLEPEVKMENGVKAEQEAEPEPVEAKVKIEPEREKELQTEADFKVESEVKVDPEELQFDKEANPDKVIEEWHIDMEGRHGPVIEPLDDDDMLKENQEILEEDEMFSMREDYVPGEKEEEEEDKVEEEEELLEKSNSILDNMESESDMMEETFQNHVASEETAMDEEASLDLMEQQMKPLSEVGFSDEETMMEMFPRQEQAVVEDEGPQMDVEEALRQEYGNRKEGHYCTGSFIDRICYQFFKEPKKYEDAESFCQNQFPGGHLASITSQYIHRDLMSLILKQNGAYTRTWVGGWRLNRDRFIWLDGSPWSYDDWLPGEPNDTAGVEDCVEVLPFGNGKFNDFTCWEPQAFICSYPYDA